MAYRRITASVAPCVGHDAAHMFAVRSCLCAVNILIQRPHLRIIHKTDRAAVACCGLRDGVCVKARSADLQERPALIQIAIRRVEHAEHDRRFADDQQRLSFKIIAYGKEIAFAAIVSARIDRVLRTLDQPVVDVGPVSERDLFHFDVFGRKGQRLHSIRAP